LRTLVDGPSGRQADRPRLRLAWFGTTPVWSTICLSRSAADGRQLLPLVGEYERSS
jgi:hypothetical protein